MNITLKLSRQDWDDKINQLLLNKGKESDMKMKRNLIYRSWQSGRISVTGFKQFLICWVLSSCWVLITVTFLINQRVNCHYPVVILKNLCWCFICFQPENPWSTRWLSCFPSYCLRYLKVFWQGVAVVFSILILLLWHFKKSRHYHQALSLTLSLFSFCLLLTICLGTYS